MPRRNTIDTITLGIFSDENVSVICEDTIKLEKGSVAVLSGNNEVGKSFLALVDMPFCPFTTNLINSIEK